MSTLREAAQQALEAMESMSDCYVGDDDDAGECASCHERSYKPHAPDCKKQNAITALRAALAQEEQEPVAWLLTGGTDVYLASEFSPGSEHEHEWTPLFTHPPRRTGLPNCEHSCEAQAFLIEIRRLKAELAAEREACAKVCEGIYTNGDGAECWLQNAAAAIRARSNHAQR